MNANERALSTYLRKPADRIPWMDLGGCFPRGSIEREARNMGLGILESAWPYDIEMPHVKSEQKLNGAIMERTYHTPKRSVKVKWNVKFGISGIGMVGEFYPIVWRINVPLPWIIEHPIKTLDDYEAVRFMIEDAVYVPNYKSLLDLEQRLGSDGLVMARIERSPIQKMFIQLMGTQRFCIDLYRHQKEIDGLYQTILEKDREAWRIAADSPAKVIWLSDNIDGVVISPRIFEKYHLPCYNELARLMHRKGKIVSVHMDGRLKSLAPLIARMEIDAIDAFTPPPMGDLSVAEAKSVWGDKFTIFMNFPLSVYLQGEEATKKYTLELIRGIAPGYGWIIGLTEDVSYNLLPVAKEVGSLLQNAYLPLSPDTLGDLSKNI